MDTKLWCLILLQFTSTFCYFDIKETSDKIRKILKKNLKTRWRRHNNNETFFAQNTLDFFKKTENFGDFLKYLNVSECSRDFGSQNSTNYVKRHIYHGLLIDFDVPDTHWMEYKKVFNKNYKRAHHEASAKTQWRNNLQHVARHNREYLAGKHTYALHLNGFADIGVDHYVNQFLKLVETVPLHDPAEDLLKTALHHSRHAGTPTRVDWRSRGFRPRREQQHGCGACYAFATTHALQAQLYRKHRNWKELSPQQIVDCSGVDGNFACDGGSLRAAMRYITREGLMMETHYPYLGVHGLCLANHLFPHVKPRRWATLPRGDEAAMEQALAHIGPLAVGLNAAPRSFQLYRSGIYDDPHCSSKKMNHAMLLVGYTPEYWILLNWWGRHWGEDGYIRIRRGNNRCGVANMATYVEL